MTEALFTALGLVLGVIATLVGLLHEEKPSKSRRLLFMAALLGLGAGLVTTWVQYQGRVADKKAVRLVQAQRDEIYKKVGDLVQVQAELRKKTEDLTMLNKLGGGHYYVVIDTFKKNSIRDTEDFKIVRSRLLTLYPNAETNGMLWKAPEPGSSSHYELRFGRNLTPSSAEIFLNLANQGLSNGRAFIRRE